LSGAGGRDVKPVGVRYNSRMDDIGWRRLQLFAALVPPLLLLGWRLLACPPELLWRDGATVLSIYALFVIAAPESHIRQPWRTRVSIPLAGLPDRGLPLASVEGSRANFYLLYGPDFSRHVAFVRIGTADELRTRLGQESIRDIYSSRSAPALRDAMEQGWLRRTVGLFFEVRPEH